MAFTIDEAFLPATLTAPPMSDEQFAEFCSEHPDLFFEMTAEGELIVMPPKFTALGACNAHLCGQLSQWTKQNATGVACGASGGFVLPDGARRSPDASWTSKSAIRQLSKESLEGYWHLCPAFVIELRSQSDRLQTLREKMHEYIANGAQLAWMIDPQTRTVEIYRPNRDPETHISPDSLKGEGPVEGFILDMTTVWDRLA